MTQEPQKFELSTIGEVISPYTEKFAIPRQPGLVTAAKSAIRLSKDCNREEILRGLEGFSHIWIVFMFHKAMKTDWKPMVRPPRLGGNEKVGVFASRSPFRPNPIGLSVVALSHIELRQKHWHIYFEGGDILNGTPVVDIKPYIPYADSIPDASGGYAQTSPDAAINISFTAQAQRDLLEFKAQHPTLQLLIEQVLAQQPQPAYQREQVKSFGMTLYDINIQWHKAGDEIIVTELQQIKI
jgi:tRNA (adenine37-N6)-methyltransferase